MEVVILISEFIFATTLLRLFTSSGVLFLFLAVVVYCIWKKSSGTNRENSPFSVDFLKPTQPLVTDHSTRNRVLKSRFRTSKVPEKLDAIIIGSGIGGLSVAVLLSRVGKKVLVLEQHDQAGGCCHTFMDKGYEFDTGIHYVGKMAEGTETRILVDQLTNGQLTWASMVPEYDVVAVGPPDSAKRYPLVAGRQNFTENLKKMFPEDKEAVDKIMRVFDENRGAMLGMILPKMLPKWLVKILIWTGLIKVIFSRFHEYASLSLREGLDQITDNEELKAVISYAYGDLGAAPKDMSLAIYSSLMNHYIPGAYYPTGGSSEIAFHMIPIIRSYGGQVLVDARVTEILINDTGRACGVSVCKNNRTTDLYSDIVISDAGVYNTLKKLLPKSVAEKTALYQMVNNVGPSHASISIFAGLEGTSEELKLPGGNIWAFLSPDLDGTLAEYLSLSEEEAAEVMSPMMFISFPSAKDPSWEERFPGKYVCLILVIVPHHWFAEWKNGRVKHRGADYESLKRRFGRKIWDQCEQLFPQLEGKLEYLDVGTPLSNRHYLGCANGEMYGMNHTKSRVKFDTVMELRPETDIPGLYLTGQDVFTAGFAGALYGGLLCTSTILNRNLRNDLKDVSRLVRKMK